MKIGVVDVGGGYRASYGAGVLDYCLSEHIHFDCGIGVSAGSANIASYFAKQFRRNYKFYTEYAFRRSYASLYEMVKHGSYINLPYIYGTLSNVGGENPLNYPAILQDPAVFEIVATDGITGKAKYFSKYDLKQDHYDVFMASCCVPVAAKPWEIDGRPYFDGGLSDPIPYERAFAHGCDKVVIILTRPRGPHHTEKNDKKLSMLVKGYPKIAADLRERSRVYDCQLAAAEELEKEGKVMIIAPDDIEGMRTLKKDKQAIKDLYHKGAKDGHKIKEWF